LDRFAADSTEASAPVGGGVQPGNFLRQLALPREVKHWSLTTLREKLIKIGAKVVRHAKAVAFQLDEVAVPRALFAAILARIGRVRAAPSAVRTFVVGGGEWCRAENDGDGPP